MSKLKRGIAKVSTALAGAMAILAPGLVLAVNTGTPATPLITPSGSTGNGTVAGTTNSFSNLINNIVTIFLYVIGIVALIYLLISGFNYITAGGDDEKATAARKGVINAIIGIIIVAAAYWILGAAIGLGSGLGTAATSF